MSQPDPHGGSAMRRRLRLIGGAFVLVAIGVVAHGMASRAAQSARLRELTAMESLPTVAVVTPTRVASHAVLELPGRMQAYIRAPIYARVPGYLQSWSHDIGSKVKAGEVLAVIETPDLDQQLRQARANLAVARANAKLAQISAERWQSLAGTDAVATQDVDQRTFTWNADIAQVKAAQAYVDLLVTEEGFKRLVAPFDGVVTARDTDIGDLINVGSAGGAELFEVSDTSKLRVYVDVPQNYVPSVPPGTRATITVPEHPDETYSATVEASAQAVIPNTGTTLMELIVDNRAGELMPGDFASVRLQITTPNEVLSVPSSALIFDARGLSVATVDANDHVLLKPVAVGRDQGSTIQLSAGLAPDDRVIENPPDGISDGAEVRLAGRAAVSGATASRARSKHNEKG
jgi:RND family efflux transporter MFP subunit